MSGAAIRVSHLAHHYRGRNGDLTVLADVNLDVGANEHIAIMGASGAGKSTLLAVLGGLEAPQEGVVEVGGRDLHRLSRNALADFRRQTVGFVFQHFGLIDMLTALENVELAGTLAGTRAAARRRRSVELLDAVGLAHRRHHRTSQLSGGERQRVAVARALMNEPKLVLADEPTGNLDDDSSRRVTELLEALPATHGCTLVVVTHDPRVTARAPRGFQLIGGRLQEATRRPGGEDKPATASAAAEGTAPQRSVRSQPSPATGSAVSAAKR